MSRSYTEEEKAANKIARKMWNDRNRERNLICMPIGRKICPDCKSDKNFEDFHILLTSKDGRQARCKICACDKTPEQMVRQREISNQWYVDNTEHHNETSKKNYELNKEEILANQKRYRQEFPEKVLACIKAAIAKNPDHYRAYQLAWQRANPEKRRESSRRSQLKHPPDPVAKAFSNKRWRVTNKELVCVLDANKRARRRGAEGLHTKAEVETLFLGQRGKCANPLCRISLKREYHEDHIVPLIKGGTNYIRNIQLLCKTCNLKKHAKDPIEWAQKLGLLL